VRSISTARAIVAVLFGARGRRQHGGGPLICDLGIDPDRSAEVLRSPFDGELAEALRQLGDVTAEALTPVAIPFQGLAQLSLAEADALESVSSSSWSPLNP
jgi:hypothetical protein